jgi:hypothetical protein
MPIDSHPFDRLLLHNKRVGEYQPRRHSQLESYVLGDSTDISVGAGSTVAALVLARRLPTMLYLFFRFRHHFARILDRVAQFACRVTENVVAILIEHRNLISVRKEPFPTFMV